jgi:hypothetical protein
MSDIALIDFRAGMDCLKRCWDSDWWYWKRGSQPHFWRWPLDYQASIRDGINLWLKEEVVRWRVPQHHKRDPTIHEGMREKDPNSKRKGIYYKGECVLIDVIFCHSER